jgi:hypothetical protein
MKKMTVFLLIYITISCGNVKTLAQEKPVYDVKDKFEMVEGIPIPKLSKNKMFLEESDNYEKYFDSNKEIKINTPTDSMYKVLSFYNEKRPTEVLEEYNISINKSLKYDYEFKIKYIVRIKYYNNGNIKSYKVHLRDIGLQLNFLEVGIWYDFDENGKVYKKIDHEKKYKTSLKDVFEIYNNLIDENLFLKEKDKNSPLMYYGNNIIDRFTNDIDDSYWILNLPEYSVVIDDKSGNIIEKINWKDREKASDNFLKNYDKSPKTEKKTGYNVADNFDSFDGVQIPKLSKDKMYFKNDKKYQKFYEKNNADNFLETKVRIIEINNQFNSLNKKLYFENDNLSQIKENYIVDIVKPNESSNCIINYEVTINYYSNGTIKDYSIYANYLDQIIFESPVGVWYKFDEKGKILTKTDIDRMYKTSYRDILQHTHKTTEESKFDDANNISKVSRFVNENGNAYWIITYANLYSEIIEDKTGTIIERLEGHDSTDKLYKKYESNSIEYKLYKEFFDEEDE